MPEPEDAFIELVRALARRRVRFVLIDVAGANYYASGAGSIFATEDFDLFVPRDPTNTLRASSVCESLSLDLRTKNELSTARATKPSRAGSARAAPWSASPAIA